MTAEAESYFAEDGEHYSTLKEMGRSPRAYLEARRAKGKESTEAQVIGTCLHWATLEPKKFEARVRIWPRESGPRKGRAWTTLEVEAQRSRLLILTEDEHDQVIAMARAVRSSPQVAPYLEDPTGEAEVPIRWKDPTTGLACKSKIDWICRRGILDLKTTKDGSPEGFGRECARYTYHRQAGFYSDGARESELGKRFGFEGEVPFAFVAIEKELPHVVQVYTVGGDVLELGRSEMRAYLERLAELRKLPASQWPGYADGPLELTLPRWAMPQEGNLDGLGIDFDALGTEGETK